MDKALIKLLEFIASNTLPFKFSKAGKGMLCYKLEQVDTHKQMIESLAKACAWELTFFKPSYIAEKNTMSAPKYYLGPIPEKKEEPVLSLEDMKKQFIS